MFNIFKKIFLRFNFILIFLLSSPLIVIAAEGHGEHHVPSISELNLFFANFAIYLVFLGYLFKKLVPKGWASRRERVRTQMEASRAKIITSERQLAEAHGKLAAVDVEVRRIEEVVNKESDHETREITENAKKAASRIIAQAHETIAAERKFAEGMLKRMYAELAIKMAEETLRRDLTPEKDAILRERTRKHIAQLIH